MFALLLTTAALLTWVANDTERVRHAIENVVSGIYDRAFIIGGEFDFDLGRLITLRADRIRWQSSVPDTSPAMLEVQGFTGTFDLFTLLHGSIVITEARASSAMLRIEWDDDEGFNWAPRTVGDSAPGRPETLPTLPLVIHKASVRSLDIHLQHPALTEELAIILREAQHRRDGGGRLAISASALLEGRQLAISSHIGPFPKSATDGLVDFDVTIRGPLARFAATGSFNWPGQLRDARLKAELKAPSAVDLAKRLKLPLETGGGVRLNAELDGEGDAILAAVNGFFGDFQVDARFRSDDLRSLQGLDMAIRSSGPSLHGLAAIVGLLNLPDAAYEFEARAQHTDQGLDLQSFRLETAGLQAEGSGIARKAAEFRDIDLQLDAEGSDFATVARLLNLEIKKRVPFNLKLAIAGNGPGKSNAVDARLQVGSTIAGVTGSISETPDLAGSRFRFTVEAPEANQLAGVIGITLPAGAKLKLRGSSSVTTDQIRFDDLKASLDDTELTGAAWLERSTAQSGFSFRGGGKGPNLARLLGPLLPDSVRTILPQRPFAVDTSLRLTPVALVIESAGADIGKSRLGFSGRVDLKASGARLTGTLSLSGDSLAGVLEGSWTEELPDTPFQLKSGLQVSSGAIRLTGLSATGKYATIGGGLGFTGKDYSRLEFDLTGRGDHLSEFFPPMDFYRPADVPFNIAVKGTSDLSVVAVERLEGRLGDVRLEMEGGLQVWPTLAARAVRLTASGQRLSELGTMGSWKLTDRPFKITSTIHSNAGEQLVEDLRFESGGNNLGGRFRYSLGGRVPTVEVALKSTYLNLDEIRLPVPDDDEPTEAAINHDRLFSEHPLPFEVLDSFNSELDLDVETLVSHQRLWRNLAVVASLAQGVLTVEHAQVDAAKGKLKVSGIVQPTTAGRSVTAHITATHAMVALEGMAAEEVDRLPQHAIAARLSASGNTPREIAASLDGFAWIIGGQGWVRRSKLGPLAGDFLTELLGAVNPLFEKKMRHVRVDCQGIYMEIANGKIETAPAIVAQTEHADILAMGAIDLASEEIDFTLEITPRKGIGVSLSDYINPFTKIAGTLMNPKITLDPKAALVEGSVAVATAGLSVLIKSQLERWFGSRQICEKVANEAVKIRGKRAPDSVPDLDQLMAGTHKPGTVLERATGRREETGKPESILDELEAW